MSEEITNKYFSQNNSTKTCWCELGEDGIIEGFVVATHEEAMKLIEKWPKYRPSYPEAGLGMKYHPPTNLKWTELILVAHMTSINRNAIPNDSQKFLNSNLNERIKEGFSNAD